MYLALYLKIKIKKFSNEFNYSFLLKKNNCLRFRFLFIAIDFKNEKFIVKNILRKISGF